MSINKKGLKIAIFHNLPSGGGLRVLKEIIPILKKQNQVKVYTIKIPKFYSFIQYLYFTLFKLKKINKNLAKEIDSKKFDIVIINHDYLTKSPYILRFLKTKNIYLCHEEPREFYSDKNILSSNLKHKFINKLRLPLKYIDKRNIKHSQINLSNSNFSKNKLESIYNKKFKKINLGVNKKIFFKNKNLKKSKIFLTVGSTSFFKGIDFLINSISLLPKKYQYKLIIVGNKGRDHKKILKIAKEKNINFELKNKVTNKELSKLYNEASLLLAAAINEPFGLSLLEAISCGTRVIAVNEGGYKEIINNKNLGELITRYELKFSEAILKNINSNIQSEEIVKFQKKWQWENTVKQIIKIATS